ncbi:MAG: autotransporter outer membrane beta-barrel domain-containing protein [Achromobacter sp.]|nr:autotransporter outer membrane beta-barrel domain-containing protein [Achromobacter sp.]
MKACRWPSENNGLRSGGKTVEVVSELSDVAGAGLARIIAAMFRFRPSYMLALVSAALAAIPACGNSAEVGGVIVTNADRVLNPGDTITYDGPGRAAVIVSGDSSALSGRQITIQAGANTQNNTMGVHVRGGSVILQQSAITTHGFQGVGLQADPVNATRATIEASDTRIETFGADAMGAVANLPGGTITLARTRVTTHGDTASGLFVQTAGARLSAADGSVNTSGNAAHGAEVVDGGLLELANMRVSATGKNAWGIASYATQANSSNTVVLSRGSQVQTQDGAALVAAGGDHRFSLNDADIVGRAGGAVEAGRLLHSLSTGNTRGVRAPNGGGAAPDIATGHITLDATGSRLVGDVLMESGEADIALKGGSSLTGALIERNGGRVKSMTLDGASSWIVRGDSSLAALDNGGTVAFAAPKAPGDFKTLTVDNYTGKGVLVLHTRLGDDASPTDRLVINAGKASGRGALRIVNAGGNGALTAQGIRVVQTINGGSTAPDAFTLDAGSSGFRASSRTLAVNGYEYSLLRGGRGGAAQDWYLTSERAAPTPTPAPAGSQQRAASSATAGQDGPRNVSPEGGAYLSNQMMSAALFIHGMHDRMPSKGGVAEPLGPGEAPTASRNVWTRVQGRRDRGLRMAQGRVTLDSERYVLQFGGDLWQAPLGANGALHLGPMAGYGEARSTSTSGLVLPGGETLRARARGKVSGYSAGVYGTAYQNDATRLGAYADTWVQYGRYSNQVSSELGSARYQSSVLSGALDAGYALAPFGASTALAPLVVEPHAGVLYSHYEARQASLQGTRMRTGASDTWRTRAGVRVYPRLAEGGRGVRPFFEADWLHSFDTPSVRMGPNRFEAAASRDSLELKLGVLGWATPALQVSGQVIGNLDGNGQSGLGGAVNLAYHW